MPCKARSSGATASGLDVKQVAACVCKRGTSLVTHLSVMINTMFAMSSILEHQVGVVDKDLPLILLPPALRLL